MELWLYWQCAGLGPMVGQAAHFKYQKENIPYAIDRYVGEAAIQPPGVLLGFLSTLIEKLGDEWGNKLMFHLRWYADIDVAASSDRGARLNMTRADEPSVAARATAVRERMADRGRFVGSSPATAPLIFDYFVEPLDLLQPHLEGRSYLLGARPSFGDFALAAQLYHAAFDPTGGR